MYKKCPDAKDLKEMFSYDDSRGALIRISGTRAGKRAGKRLPSGYIRVSIKSESYLEHRLIWAMHFGEIPEGMQIDHINGIAWDNRVENLRLASPRENQQNYPGGVGAIAVTGCHYNSKRRKFVAAIRTNGKQKHLGYSDTKEEAGEAYAEAKRIYHTFHPVARDLRTKLGEV
jgi:hypothetical protein